MKKVAIIGGSGLYDIEDPSNAEELNIDKKSGDKTVQNRCKKLFALYKHNFKGEISQNIFNDSFIYESIMKWSECKKMIVPLSGLPDGIIHELYDYYTNPKI